MTDTDMIGHNRPDYAAETINRLTADYGALVDTVEELGEAVALLPRSIAEKEDHDRLSDMVAKLRGVTKTVEAQRTAEKEPFLKSERAVDGFFGDLKAKLAVLSNPLVDEITRYLNRKAEEERQARLRAAEEERRRAEKLRAEQEDRERRAEEAKRRDYRERNKVAAESAAEAAEDAEDRAAAHEDSAAAKPADLARTRSDQGTLSTLKSEWTFAVEDLDAIPIEKLRPYIPEETIKKAIRAYVRMGGRQLPGVRIFETTKAQVR